MSDLAYAARGLRRSPAFAAIAVLTLALGIGADTALVGIIDAVTSGGGATNIDDVYVLERDNFRASGIGSDRTPRELFDALRAAPSNIISAVAATTVSDGAIVQAGPHGDLLIVRAVSASMPRVFPHDPAGRQMVHRRRRRLWTCGRGRERTPVAPLVRRAC